MRARWTYSIAATLSIAIAIVLLRLPEADLFVPFSYGGDVLFYQAVIKGIITNGWYLHNPSLGMPFGSDLHDFPMPDTLSYAVLKVLGYVLGDSGLVINVFFLLTLPLTTVTALWALTRLHISTGPALCCALLYSFSNYHINRCVNHLMYTAYFAVPLLILVALRLTAGVARKGDTAISLLICVVVASTGGAYNTCFAMFVLGGAAVLRALEQRSWKAAGAPLALAAFTGLVMIANLTPNILYRAEHGAVPVAVRPAHDSETFGLKPSQLVLPVLDHRIPALSNLRAHYHLGQLNNENFDCTLGFVGAIGFILLVAWLLFAPARREPPSPVRRLWDHLSSLNAICLLVGTVGGVGALVALLISPQIRAYNRISTFLLFLSLCAAGLVLERVSRLWDGSRPGRWAMRTLLVILTGLGLLDQLPTVPLLPFEPSRKDHRNDAEFFARVEAIAPPLAMVFQLPVDVYPEGKSYEHLKAYLHTNGLRWSYGAMQHRHAHRWQERVAEQPVDRLVETLAIVGFAGVVVDRSQLPQEGAELEGDLTRAGARLVLSSETPRWSYFDLGECERKLRGGLSDRGWAKERDAVLNPMVVEWRKGFYPPAVPPPSYRWADPHAVLELEHVSTAPQTARFAMSLASLTPGTVRVRTPWTDETVPLPGDGHQVPYARDLLVLPGRHAIRLDWTGLPTSQPTGWPPFVVDNPGVTRAR